MTDQTEPSKDSPESPHMNPVGTPNFAEREFEIGKDESWAVNLKRLHDEYMHESLESIRRTRHHFDKLASDAQQHDNARQEIANQSLQNAVETANMVSKQSVRHTDIATDRTWNVDEVATLVAKTGVMNDAISAAVAAAVSAALTKKD